MIMITPAKRAAAAAKKTLRDNEAPSLRLLPHNSFVTYS